MTEETTVSYTQTPEGKIEVQASLDRKVNLFGESTATKWQIAKAILQGNETKDSLIEKFITPIKKNAPTKATAKNLAVAFASQLNYLRMGYFFPIVLDADTERGVYSLLDENQYFAYRQIKDAQAATKKKSAGNRKVKNPALRIKEALARVTRLSGLSTNAADNNLTLPTDINDLKQQVAELNVKISKLQLDELTTKYSEIDVNNIDEEVAKATEAVETPEVVDVPEDYDEQAVA